MIKALKKINIPINEIEINKFFEKYDILSNNKMTLEAFKNIFTQK